MGLTLPARYRIPKGVFRYTIFAGVATAVVVGLMPWGLGLTGWPLTTVTVASLAIIAVVVLRIWRMGTVVTTDGVIRRGFLGDRHHAWHDVHAFELTDREVVHTAYGFQVSSRFVVSVSVGPHRRRKTLLFLDERAFTSFERFLAEVDAIAALWDRRRGTPHVRNPPHAS